MRKIKKWICSIVAIVIISVPMVIAMVHSSNKSEDGVRELTENDIQIAIESNTEPETETITEVDRLNAMGETEFSGYSFIPLDSHTQILIYNLCDKYEIAYDLMIAIGYTESEMQMQVSKSGDYGIWQINKDTWETTAIELGLADYKTDILQNCEMGLYVLSEALKKSDGKLVEALNYYNSGKPYPINYNDGTTYSGRVFANYDWVTSGGTLWER